MPTPNDHPLPNDWTDQELKETVRREFGIGSDGDLPANTRFMKNVAQLIRRRLAKGGENGELAVFLLSPTIPSTALGQTTRTPMLDNALTKLSGHFWLVTEVVAAGNSLPIPEALTDDDLFKFVVDNLGLGEAPSMILDTRVDVPTVRYYSKGLSQPNTMREIAVFGVSVGLNEVFESVERTYTIGLSSPQTHGAIKLWENAKKHEPVSDAERIIQQEIKVGLANAFPTCTVREEQGMPVGRLDLEIEEADPLNRTKITRHAILELKVLRSHFSGGATVSDDQNRTLVSEGVVQAAEYRDDRSALAAALCCFDMRKSDTQEKCFEHALADAAQKQVTLRRWYIHNKAKGYRKSKAA